MPTSYGHLLATTSLAILIAAFAPGNPSVVAEEAPAGFFDAQDLFERTHTIEQREYFQVLLSAAGYYQAVPNERFGLRLYNAVKRFQADNGFLTNGIVDQQFETRLRTIANPLLDKWGFTKVVHPTRKVVVWIPLGLGLIPTNNPYGLSYSDPLKRLSIDFLTIPDTDIKKNHDAVVEDQLLHRAALYYNKVKDGWYVISSSTPDGADHYLRYHQDGNNVTGFSLSWDNSRENVAADRIATLMSASLWSSMTGATFVDPPAAPPRREVPKTEPIPAPPTAQIPATPTAPVPAPPKEMLFSMGTGVFVNEQGYVVTNNHVVEGCADRWVKTEGEEVQQATLVANDKVNDLALLRVVRGSNTPARLRTGVRLGETVAAFGFPHTNELSPHGNFTMGNVTALSLGNDVRYLQISAPIQRGNSGGPLLDDNGNLIGVVSLKISKWNDPEELPQNIAFAIKTEILQPFLDANNVKYNINTPNVKPLSPVEIASGARALSTFVICH